MDNSTDRMCFNYNKYLALEYLKAMNKICIYCGSKRTKKNRINKSIQNYRCSNCNR